MTALNTVPPASKEADRTSKGISFKNVLLKLLIGVLLSSVVVYVLSYRIDLNRLLQLAGEVEFGPVVAAVCVYWGSLFLRACRWKVLIGNAPTSRLRPLFVAFLIGAGFNTLIPAKIGELFRMQISSSWLQISRMRLAGGIFIEKCQDMLVLLVFFVGGIFIVANQSMGSLLVYKIVLSSLFILSVVGTIFLVLFLFYPRLLGRVRGNKLVLMVDSFISGITGAVSTGVIKNSILTTAIWATDLSTLWLILHSMQIDLQVLELMLLTGAYSFVSLVPSAPVHLGTYQAAFVFVFATLGYSAESAFLGALLVQLGLLVPVALFAVAASFWCWRDFLRNGRA